MAKPITTTSKTGVITGFSKVGIVIGVPPNVFAIVKPDDGTKEVSIEVGDFGEEYFAVGNNVRYTVTDGPLGPLAAALEKA